MTPRPVVDFHFWDIPVIYALISALQFGAFVELAPGKDGLVHISKLANHRVEKVEDVCKIGDMMWVKVTEIDEKGRVNLSWCRRPRCRSWRRCRQRSSG